MPDAYGPADRLLHALALSWRPVMEASFDIESARFGRAASARPLGPPIFVCGLARAGTSLATRLIAAVPGIASPSYRDMPFPLAPNLWTRLTGKGRRVEASQRGHGDGMSHDLDTPEAVEEVFWRCFEGRHYLRPDGIGVVAPEPETLASFRRYMALVALRGGGERYLSKNNNNVVRILPLAEAFPDALFVHPFRHPLSHIASLRKQHERVSDLQRASRFRWRYATWLGHHEFGLGRLPFLLPKWPAADGDPEGDDYWLASWNAVHGHLLDQPDSIRRRQFFLDFDGLRTSPDAWLRALARFLRLSDIPSSSIRSGSRDDVPPNASLPPDTNRIYSALSGAASIRGTDRTH